MLIKTQSIQIGMSNEVRLEDIEYEVEAILGRTHYRLDNGQCQRRYELKFKDFE